MNPTACVTQRTGSPELGSSPSIPWKMGDRPPGCRMQGGVR
jgi:hypothetical protein